MILANASLAKRVFLPTLGLFALSMGALSAIQYGLYVRGFEQTLGRIEDSSLSVKREAAQGQLQGIRVASERLLQTGESKQFVALADQQRQRADITAISFIGPSRKVELASPPERVGQSVDDAVWAQAGSTKDSIIMEDAATLSAYQPLYVDADMRRLNPDLEVGQLYGLLHLEFSKDKINGMLAQARGTFQAAVTRSLWMSAGSGGLALLVMALSLLPLIVRPLVRSLKRVISSLDADSNELVDISRQIAASSDRLAHSASQQASSLEETSSAMEQMEAMTRVNADNAQKANGLAAQTREGAAAGDKTMGRLNQAMTAINESAGKISRIIKVIEEIAFQTNLLALNAAVEAARAGEHGRGFAVVAEEVRNLAKRAAAAASETTVLIEDSVNRSREGKQVVDEVGKSLGAISGDATQVSELVGGIAKASQEQAQGVEQVNSAVTEMNRMTQETVAEAEESSAVAEHLGKQAGTVKDMVDQLLAVVNGAKGGRQCASIPTADAQEREPAVVRTAKPSALRNAARAGRATSEDTKAVGHDAEGPGLSDF